MNKVKAQNIIDNTNALQQNNQPSDLVTRMAAANELANNAEVVKEIKKYDKTPVVYFPTRSMMRPAANPGLLNYIRKASSVEEVEKLVKRIPKFEYAQDSTIRKWNKAAEKRIRELSVISEGPRKGQHNLEVLVEGQEVVKKDTTKKSKKVSKKS